MPCVPRNNEAWFFLGKRGGVTPQMVDNPPSVPQEHESVNQLKVPDSSDPAGSPIPEIRAVEAVTPSACQPSSLSLANPYLRPKASRLIL